MLLVVVGTLRGGVCFNPSYFFFLFISKDAAQGKKQKVEKKARKSLILEVGKSKER